MFPACSFLSHVLQDSLPKIFLLLCIILCGYCDPQFIDLPVLCPPDRTGIRSTEEIKKILIGAFTSIRIGHSAEQVITFEILLDLVHAGSKPGVYYLGINPLVLRR